MRAAVPHRAPPHAVAAQSTPTRERALARNSALAFNPVQLKRAQAHCARSTVARTCGQQRSSSEIAHPSAPAHARTAQVRTQRVGKQSSLLLRKLACSSHRNARERCQVRTRLSSAHAFKCGRSSQARTLSQAMRSRAAAAQLPSQLSSQLASAQREPPRRGLQWAQLTSSSP